MLNWQEYRYRLFWLLLLSAIFWGGLILSGAIQIEPNSARPSQLESHDPQSHQGTSPRPGR